MNHVIEQLFEVAVPSFASVVCFGPLAKNDSPHVPHFHWKMWWIEHHGSVDCVGGLATNIILDEICKQLEQHGIRVVHFNSHGKHALMDLIQRKKCQSVHHSHTFPYCVVVLVERDLPIQAAVLVAICSGTNGRSNHQLSHSP